MYILKNNVVTSSSGFYGVFVALTLADWGVAEGRKPQPWLKLVTHPAAPSLQTLQFEWTQIWNMKSILRNPWPFKQNTPFFWYVGRSITFFTRSCVIDMKLQPLCFCNIIYTVVFFNTRN